MNFKIVVTFSETLDYLDQSTWISRQLYSEQAILVKCIKFGTFLQYWLGCNLN